jgi:predicted RND superfamily exporter protein
MNSFGPHFNPRKRELDLLTSMACHAIQHPRRILLMAVVVVIAFSPGVCRLKLRTDGYALSPSNAPEVACDRSIRSSFGIDDQIIVMIRSKRPDGIFEPRTVQLVRYLTAALEEMPGIQHGHVMSLATEPSFRYRPQTLILQRLLEPPLTTPAELSRLREDLRRIGLYTGTLVSKDGKMTLILVDIPDSADRFRLYSGIKQLVAGRTTSDVEVGVTGAPVAEALLGVQILEDLGVPAPLLGIHMLGKPSGKWPASWHEARLMAVRSIGLVPLAALVMMLVFLFCFRNLLAALLPLPGAVATLLCVFGTMGWCGVPVYLTTAVMPVLLTVISVTNDIYLFSRYFNLLRENPGADHLELLRETFRKLAVPVACTSLASVAGFLSFTFSRIVPVRMFGLFTGFGAMTGLLLSFTVVPALLALVPPRWLVSPGRQRSEYVVAVLSEGFAALGEILVRRRWRVVGFALLLLALAPLGLHRLKVQDSWINGFDPESDFRQVTEQVNGDFFGIHNLLVTCNASEVITGSVASAELSPGSISLPLELLASPELVEGNPITLYITGIGSTQTSNNVQEIVWHTQVKRAGQIENRMNLQLGIDPMPEDFSNALSHSGEIGFKIVVLSHTRPEIIQRIGGLSAFIRQQKEGEVGGVLDPLEYLVTTAFMTDPEDPNARQLPNQPNQVKTLWNFYRVARGERLLREVVNTNFSESLTTVFLKDANFVDTARLMSAIRAYARTNLEPQGIKIGFAGDVAVSQALIHGIVVTQLQSLIWSLLSIFAVTAWFGGSWRWGLYCLLPSALAVLIKFSVMGWSGIPLGVATSMFAAMTLGIGVNCAIHLLEGCRQAQAAGASPSEALSRSLNWTGPPALINTLAMSLGFGVLMLSQVPANARLGILLVLGLVNCFVASLLISPVLLHWWPLRASGVATDVSSPHKP